MSTSLSCSCPACQRDYILQLKNEGNISPALSGPAMEKDVLMPTWFNKDLYLKGQQFFQANFMCIFVCKLAGLFSILHIPNIRDVLSSTNKSSSTASAARRYLSTLRHIHSWYDGTVEHSGEKANLSVLAVRRLHLRAICPSDGGEQKVSQIDMVATQWAFCGLVALKWKELGIKESSLHMLDGFIHFWRTMGFLFGVEDRFNLCPAPCQDPDELVSSWRANCLSLLHQVIAPAVVQEKEQSLVMSEAMLKGSKHIVPFIDDKVFRCYTLDLLELNRLSLEAQESFSNYQSMLHSFQVHFLGTLLHTFPCHLVLRPVCNKLMYIAMQLAYHPQLIKSLDYIKFVINFVGRIRDNITLLMTMILVIVLGISVFLF